MSNVVIEKFLFPVFTQDTRMVALTMSFFDLHSSKLAIGSQCVYHFCRISLAKASHVDMPNWK